MSVKLDLEYDGVISKTKKSQLRIEYTPIKTIQELKTILRKANIKLEKDGVFNKSYFKEHDENYIIFNYKYVLWVEREGFITMTYDTDDNPSEIKEFTDKIEKSAGGKLFFKTKKGAETRLDELNPPPKYIYQTKFTDKSIVEQIFKENKINAIPTTNGYQFNLFGFSIKFYETKEGNYEFDATGKGNIDIIEQTLQKMTDSYDKIVQYNICENIKKKVAKSQTMQLEQEEVLEDNSVLLTIRI